MRCVVVVLTMLGCAYEPPDENNVDVDASSAGTDGTVDVPVMPLDIAHVKASDEAMLDGNRTLVIATDTQLDTSTGVFDPPIAADVLLADQEGGGRALLIVHALRIEIATNITLRVRGDRALVLTAAEIVVAGTIDVSSDALIAGAGGYSARTGPGAGANAIGVNGFDTGASGGGHGAPGGRGGNESSIPITGPTGGIATNTPQLAQLDGGSGGGRATPVPCGDGGAGGGAVQLTALRVEIDGRIDAGGGGGQGGNECVIANVSDASGGSGGGAGGAIYIQSNDVIGGGWLVANGGGGGGGGCRSCVDRSGDNGANGSLDAAAAPGGVSPLDSGLGQGQGGAGASIGTAMAGNAGTNAGGGGGGPGRIFVTSAALASTLNSSPALVR